MSTWTALGRSLGYHGTWASDDRNMGILSVVHKPYVCMLTGVREGHWGVLPPSPSGEGCPYCWCTNHLSLSSLASLLRFNALSLVYLLFLLLLPWLPDPSRHSIPGKGAGSGGGDGAQLLGGTLTTAGYLDRYSTATRPRLPVLTA